MRYFLNGQDDVVDMDEVSRDEAEQDSEVTEDAEEPETDTDSDDDVVEEVEDDEV